MDNRGQGPVQEICCKKQEQELRLYYMSQKLVCKEQGWLQLSMKQEQEMVYKEQVQENCCV